MVLHVRVADDRLDEDAVGEVLRDGSGQLVLQAESPVGIKPAVALEELKSLEVEGRLGKAVGTPVGIRGQMERSVGGLRRF